MEELKRNRATGTLDQITCRNGKCHYECVWTQADKGQWFCVYALSLYDWMQLGDWSRFESRGCVGAYLRPGGGVPAGATCGTRLIFSVSNNEPLNPFGK